MDLLRCDACDCDTFDGEVCLICYYRPVIDEYVLGPIPYYPECGENASIVLIDHGSRCIKCGASFGSLSICEYCQELSFSEDWQFSEEYEYNEYGSFWFGCANCHGRSGELMSRDDELIHNVRSL